MLRTARKGSGQNPLIRIPQSIIKRGIKWQYVCFSRGSGQYPGGNPDFTGDQPPCLLLPCEDGTCQHIELPVPDELVKHDCYTRASRGVPCPEGCCDA